MAVFAAAGRGHDGRMTYQVTMAGRSFFVSALTPTAAEVCALQLIAADMAKDPAVAEASKSISVTALE
jgi:hypothetical protein